MVKGSIRTSTSRLKNDLAFSASLFSEGAPAVLNDKLVRFLPRLVTESRALLSAVGDLNRSRRSSVSGVPVRFRMEKLAAIVVVWSCFWVEKKEKKDIF